MNRKTKEKMMMYITGANLCLTEGKTKVGKKDCKRFHKMGQEIFIAIANERVKKIAKRRNKRYRVV